MSRDFSKTPLHAKYRPSVLGFIPPDDRLEFWDRMPTPSADLVRFLEQEFPARCRERGEDEMEHERYAGKVELVAALRERLEDDADADISRIGRMEVEIPNHPTPSTSSNNTNYNSKDDNDDVSLSSTSGTGEQTTAPARSRSRSPRSTPAGDGNRRST